jgi:hypothetical protein
VESVCGSFVGIDLKDLNRCMNTLQRGISTFFSFSEPFSRIDFRFCLSGRHPVTFSSLWFSREIHSANSHGMLIIA